MVHVAGAMVAKKVVELAERARNVSAAAAIDDVEVLAGVGVIEAQAMLVQNGLGVDRQYRKNKRDDHNGRDGTQHG